MKFELPKAPPQQAGLVKAWSEPVVIPTDYPLRPRTVLAADWMQSLK